MIDCTDEQLIEEVRRRGFVIKDAQIGRKWVGLTAEEAKYLISHFDWRAPAEQFVSVIETKLKEKNA